MIEAREHEPVQFTAPNGVTWTRVADGTSTGPELVQALADLVNFYDVARRWNWWQEDRRHHEWSCLMRIVHEWDNGAVGSEDAEADAREILEVERVKVNKLAEDEKQRRADLVAKSYDKDREYLRLKLLRAESDAAFFRHVVDRASELGGGSR